MTVVYQDELGYVAIDTDDHSIDFHNGCAYFTGGDQDYRVPVEHLIAIQP